MEYVKKVMIKFQLILWCNLVKDVVGIPIKIVMFLLTIVQSVMSTVMRYYFVLPHSLIGTQSMIEQSWWSGALDNIIKSIHKLWMLHIFSIDTHSLAAMSQIKVNISETFERRNLVEPVKLILLAKYRSFQSVLESL